jgi:hypothetical protein
MVKASANIGGVSGVNGVNGGVKSGGKKFGGITF